MVGRTADAHVIWITHKTVLSTSLNPVLEFQSDIISMIVTEPSRTKDPKIQKEKATIVEGSRKWLVIRVSFVAPNEWKAKPIAIARYKFAAMISVAKTESGAKTHILLFDIFQHRRI